MIAVWMIYATVVSGLLTLAAWGAEQGLRLQRCPVRQVWAVALVISLSLPLAALGWSSPAEAAAAASAATSSGSPDPMFDAALAALLQAAPSALARANPYILAAWGLLTLLALVLFAGGRLRLTDKVRRWHVTQVEGATVRVSEAFGPAVVGALRPVIVLPRWALALDRERLGLVVRHETEHVKGRDTLLLSAAYLASALVPWNPFIWWQFARLRLAVEIDCDRRVLAGNANPRRYAALLLHLSQVPGRALLATAALSEPKSFLERRIEMLSKRSIKRRGARTVAALAVVVGSVMVACDVPAPTAVRPPAPTLDVVKSPAGQRDETAPPPIIVVDGIRLTPNQNHTHLAPNQIKRIEVIKGAAAIEAYGSEGAGGVIEIFTRSGKGFEGARIVPAAQPETEASSGAASALAQALERIKSWRP